MCFSTITSHLILPLLSLRELYIHSGSTVFFAVSATPLVILTAEESTVVAVVQAFTMMMWCFARTCKRRSILAAPTMADAKVTRRATLLDSVPSRAAVQVDTTITALRVYPSITAPQTTAAVPRIILASIWVQAAALVLASLVFTPMMEGRLARLGQSAMS